MQIELLKPHEHAGALFLAGAVLTIDESQGQWLIDLQVARRAKVAKPITLSVSANSLSKPIEETSK